MDLDQLMAYANANPDGGRSGPSKAGGGRGAGGQDQVQIGQITGKRGKVTPLPEESTDSPFYKPKYQQRPAPQKAPLPAYNPPFPQQKSSPPPRAAPKPSSPSKPRAAASTSGNSTASVLLTCKRDIAQSLFDNDPEMTGFVQNDIFQTLLQNIAVVSVSEIQKLIANYDPLNVGFFNYFTLLSDISNQGSGSNSASSSIKRSSPPPAQAQYEEEYTTTPMPKAKGSNRLPKLSQILSQTITKVFDSGPSAFHKWRGGSKFLRAQDFANGANRDLGMDMTVQEAQMLIDRVGGEMSVSRFVILLGKGYDGKF